MSTNTELTKIRFKAVCLKTSKILTIDLIDIVNISSLFDFLGCQAYSRMVVKFNGRYFYHSEFGMNLKQMGIGKVGNPSSIVIGKLDNTKARHEPLFDINFKVINQNSYNGGAEEIAIFYGDNYQAIRLVLGSCDDVYEIISNINRALLQLKFAGAVDGIVSGCLLKDHEDESPVLLHRGSGYRFTPGKEYKIISMFGMQPPNGSSDAVTIDDDHN